MTDLQPGDLFTICDERGVFECQEVVRLKLNGITPELSGEVAPYVRAWELEGPRGALRRRQFRAIRLARVTGKVDGRVAA